MKERVLQFTVTEQEAGKTVRDVLRSGYGVSRRLLVRLKQEQGIRVNGVPVPVTYCLQQGEQVTLELTAENSPTLLPEPMPLEIRHEDEDLLILAKPAGLVVHPTRNYLDGTLANGVMAYWQEKGEQRRFRPVNRLDKDTSGLLIVAKNQWTHEQFSRMQEQRLLERIYLAIVHGKVEPAEGVVDAPIGLAEGSIIQRQVRADGQPARTQYRVVARGEEYSVLELRLDTGRTHQIRVHMSYLGHPLAGDDLYGGSRRLIFRQALHASRLLFPHPRTQQIIDISEPLPPDMADLLRFISPADPSPT